MKILVVGLIGNDDFHRVDLIVKDLSSAKDSNIKYDRQEMFEFEWQCYLNKRKKTSKFCFWDYNDGVVVEVDGEVLGNKFSLMKFVKEKFDYIDYRTDVLISSIAKEAYKNKLTSSNKTYVNFEINIANKLAGNLMFELHSDILPVTCENFKTLCTGSGPQMLKNELEEYKPSYNSTIFHRIVPCGWIQGGDILYGKGNDGFSSYGQYFADENFIISHDSRGILSMANCGRHTNASQFFITLNENKWMDKRYVAFGRVVNGYNVLKEMESVPTKNERPVKDIRIGDIKIVDPTSSIVYLS